MSELAIKRNKIAREISRYQKLTYFKSRRYQLLASYEGDHEDYDYTSPQTNWLKQISDRSLRDNELKYDIQQQSLLKTLEHIALSTIKGRDIEIIQVILSNILLDNISLDTKEEIVKLCLACFELKVFDEYSFNNKSSDLSIMKTIVHTMNSLAVTMNKVDEELGIKCQKLITRQLIKCLCQIKECLKNVKKEDQQQMLHLFSLISNTIIKLIYRQREYYNESYMIFQRNISSFYQILQLHAHIAFNNDFNFLVKKIHLQMLQIELYLTEVFSRQNFQMYFESRQLISIVIKEIYDNRDEELSRSCLKILFNLLRQYENNQILLLLSLIQSDIHLQDRFLFFTKLLTKDALSEQRMQLLQYFIKSNEGYSLIQPYFQSHWKDIFDECYYSIKEMASNESIELALSILFFSRYRLTNSYDYLQYLKIIGLQGLLEYMFTTYDVNSKLELEFQIGDSTRQKVGKMLQFLEEQ